MTLSLTNFLAVWGTLVLAWAALLFQYRTKWDVQLEELSAEIRSYNAPRYDQSVGKESLAKDYRVPTKRSNLDQYARNNKIEPDEYINELRDNVGRLDYLFWAIAFHVTGLLLIGLGFTVIADWEIIHEVGYLVILFLWISTSWMLYWLL